MRICMFIPGRVHMHGTGGAFRRLHSCARYPDITTSFLLTVLSSSSRPLL